MKSLFRRSALVLFTATLALTAIASRASTLGGAPATITNARQYDFQSHINGQTYRVWVAAPAKVDPAVAYPVLYLLDGNITFAAAAYESRAPDVAPAIVVGIGYPIDAEWSQRRVLDLTPYADKGSDLPPGAKSGGGDAFLRVIQEEVKPLVAAHYKVDATKQTLFGYSFSALLALHELFRNPAVFSTYILVSPSIWYNDREVLADEGEFSKQARAGRLHLKILVTSSGEEQYRGNDPKQLAEDKTYRMVDNASELADRLGKLNPANIAVTRTIFEGETHTSGMLAGLSRAIRFALPPPK